MAFPRWAGLLVLYVGAQLVALVLALPFKSEGLATTSNPNSAASPLPFIIAIVVAPLVILWIARRSGGLVALRYIILGAIGASLDLTLTATFELVLRPTQYAPPTGAGFVIDLAVGAGATVAVALTLALVVEPQWWVVDTAGFAAAGSLIALLGISFGILPTFILLGALAVYDAIAVYRTRHMISLADVVTEMRLPILLVMPTRRGYDYPQSGSFTAQRHIPVEEREAVFMGLGDVVIPGTLVVSAFVWLPTVPVLGGIGGNLVAALGALVGSLVGYAVLMRRVDRGTAQAGLPFLNGGAIAGYIVAYLLVFHSFSLGLSLSL